MSLFNQHFLDHIWEVVKEIPYGKVATYGQIAKLTGYPHHARMVGKALSYCFLEEVPCYRVVNHQGRLAPHFFHQRMKLESEGVCFLENGCVNLKQCGWEREVQ